jgi:hypothetical protein
MPEQLATPVLTVGWVGFGMSTIAVTLRFWVRLSKLRQRPAAHDYLMAMDLVSNLIVPIEWILREFARIAT